MENQECGDHPEACPECGGDCSAANPPVIGCPMRDRAESRQTSLTEHGTRVQRLSEVGTLPWRYRVAAWIGAKAMRVVYGECETDVRDDFPGEDVRCVGCEATVFIRDMEDIARGR